MPSALPGNHNSLFQAVFDILQEIQRTPAAEGSYTFPYPMHSEEQVVAVDTLLKLVLNYAYRDKASEWQFSRSVLVPGRGVGEFELTAENPTHPLRVRTMIEGLKQWRGFILDRLSHVQPGDGDYMHVPKTEDSQSVGVILRPLGQWHHCEDSPVIGMGEAWLRKNTDGNKPPLSIDRKAIEMILTAERGNSPEIWE